MADTKERANGEGPGRVGSAMVAFFTTTYPKSMPEQTYSVPLNVLPEGLNKLLQSILEVDEGQRFDFLYHDEYIDTTLERFLQRRRIGYEELLDIEYTPALQAKEGSLLPHDDWVSSVRAPFLGRADLLLTGAYDHCVRLWDGDNCLALGTFHKECAKEVCVHSLVAPAAGGADDGAKASRKRQRHRVSSAAEADVVFASCSKDGSIAAWRYDSVDSEMKLLGCAYAHADGVDSIDISPAVGGDAQPRLVATASWDTTVKVFHWDQLLSGDSLPSKKAPAVSFTDHSRPVLACRFSEAHGAARVYSAGLDSVIKCLDVERAQLQGQLAGDHPVNAIAVRPATGGAADFILAGCTDNRARLYDPRQRTAVKTFGGHRQWLYSVAWLWNREEGDAPHSGGALFATSSEDATVRVYDLRCTNTALLTLDALHTDGVLDVTYVGQSTIASCGKDNKTKSFSLEKDGAP